MNFMTWEWQFGKISYDSWGSHESIQILQSQGYEAERGHVRQIALEPRD